VEKKDHMVVRNNDKCVAWNILMLHFCMAKTAPADNITKKARRFQLLETPRSYLAVNCRARLETSTPNYFRLPMR
jgi:hypothetical protein